MRRKIFKERFAKVIVFMIITNFIFAGVPVSGYAGVSGVDKLRTRSEVMTDGGKSLKGDLVIENYKKAIKELEPQVLAADKAVYEKESELLINLVNKLTPQNINKDYLLEIISTAIGIINSNTELYLKRYFIDPRAVTHSPEALLIDLSVNVIRATFALINTLKLVLTQQEISYLEDEINGLEADASSKLLISFRSFDKGQKKLALADGGNIIVSLPNKQEILEELRNPQAGTIFYAVISDKSSDTDTVISAIAKAYLENVAGLQGKNIIAFPVIQGELNDETRFILKEAGINTEDLIFLAEDKVEDLLVGLEKKNAILHIALTDHSTIHAEKENLALLEGKIEQVIDHHKVNIKIEPEKIVYANVGSTNTLIFEGFHAAKIDIPKNLALLMLSAILSDTKNLKVVNVTNRDTEAVEKLKEILKYSAVDVKNLFVKQTYILNTIDEKSLLQSPLKKITSGDRLRYSKIGGVEKYSFTVCPLNYDEKGLFEKLWPKILEYIQTDMQKRNLDIALFNLTHLTEEADVSNEELYIIGTENNVFQYKPALRIFAQDKLEKTEDLSTGVSVYRLEHNKRFARKETNAKITDYFSYIQLESTIYSVSGGRALDNLIKGISEKASEMLKVPTPKLKISIEKKSDSVIQVIWKFGGITVMKNFRFGKTASIDVDEIVREVDIIKSYWEVNNFDLRKEEDYKNACEIITGSLGGDELEFVIEKLLPAIKKELSNSKKNQRIEEEPRVFLVTPDVFRKGGVRNALRKAAELNKVANIKVALYGDKTEELKDILGIENENIITAKNLDELLKEFANRNIGSANTIALIAPEAEDRDITDRAKLKAAGIRQIVTPGITTLAVAKGIKELFSDFDFVRQAFNEFLSRILIEDNIILPINSGAHMKILDELKEGVFEFPEQVKPNPDVTEIIKKATDSEAFKKLIEEFI